MQTWTKNRWLRPACGVFLDLREYEKKTEETRNNSLSPSEKWQEKDKESDSLSKQKLRSSRDWSMCTYSYE